MAVTIPGYKLACTLGKGGMATVYLAEQEIFERQVALKVMSRALGEDDTFGQRFFREARIVSQLAHPNIVTVYDVGVHEGIYYLSMEYIEGDDLKTARKFLTLKQKINTIIDIARALDYAGSKGYVHRDIKPENIMFNSSDGRAILMDFGIARAAESDQSMTQTGTAIGTPHYMSPEQAKGKQVDHRSDLYSLGVVFYLLLTGRVLFDAESAVAIGIKHITEPVPLLPDGMGALQPILDGLLAKKPESRYQVAAQLIADLERLDVRLLEQSIAYADSNAAEAARPANDRNAITQPMRGGSDLDESFNYSGGREKITVVYDDQDAGLNTGRSFIPYVLLLTVIVATFGWVGYQYQPALVKPWIEKSGHLVLDTFGSAMSWTRNLFEPDSDSSNDSSAVNPKPKAQNPVPSKVTDRTSTNNGEASAVIKPKPTATKPSVKATSPAPAAANINTLTEHYYAKIHTLNNLYAQDGTYLGDLVAAYRALLAEFPKELKAQEALDLIKVNEFGKVRDLAEAGDLTAAKARLRQLQPMFASWSGSEFAALESWVDERVLIDKYLRQAQSLLQDGSLIYPKTPNVIQQYQAVLAIEPQHAEALAGVDNALAMVFVQASERYRANQLMAAEQQLQQLLQVAPNHSDALALNKKISAIQWTRRAIARDLEKAQARMDEEAYFIPAGDAAYHYYTNVLERDEDNRIAREGMVRLVDAFASHIWQLMGHEGAAQAQAELNVALQYLPSNARLNSLSQAVAEMLSSSPPSN